MASADPGPGAGSVYTGFLADRLACVQRILGQSVSILAGTNLRTCTNSHSARFRADWLAKVHAPRCVSLLAGAIIRRRAVSEEAILCAHRMTGERIVRSQLVSVLATADVRRDAFPVNAGLIADRLACVCHVGDTLCVPVLAAAGVRLGTIRVFLAARRANGLADKRIAVDFIPRLAGANVRTGAIAVDARRCADRLTDEFARQGIYHGLISAVTDTIIWRMAESLSAARLANRLATAVYVLVVRTAHLFSSELLFVLYPVIQPLPRLVKDTPFLVPVCLVIRDVLRFPVADYFRADRR